jgi:hypothetical protein
VIDLLILLLKPALAAVEGKSRNPLHWLAALVAYALDIVIAHTSLALIAGWPQRGEWTISQVLERLALDTEHRDYLLFLALSKRINQASPTGKHIKLP